MKIEGLQYADQCCWKLPMGEVPWSPRQLQVLWHRLGYWQLVIKKVVGGKISTHLIECTQEKGLIDRILLQDITYAEATIAEEQHVYKTYMTFKQAHSRGACNTFLEELADAIATEGGMKHAFAMKTLRTQEYIQCTH